MIEEFIFKETFAVEFVLFIILRQHYIKKYVSNEDPLKAYPWYVTFLAVLSGVFFVIVPAIYVMSPFLDSFSLKLDDIIRIAGGLLFVLSIVFMWLVLRELNINFSPTADKRYVVKTGPYKIVRHPMYTVFMLQTIAQTLLSSNIFVLAGVPVILVFLIVRVTYEDQLLLKEFGYEYLTYKRSTKAFIPLIW